MKSSDKLFVFFMVLVFLAICWGPFFLFRGGR